MIQHCCILATALLWFCACLGCPGPRSSEEDTAAQDTATQDTATQDTGAQWTSVDPPDQTADRWDNSAATAQNAALPSMQARKRATNVRAGGIQDITFDDLEFPIQRDQDFDVSMVTDKIRELEGKHVILRGFILASTIFQQTGIEQFVLVRDNQECCFGPGAYLYHNVQVEMVPPKTANFTIRPVTIHGTFSLRPWTAEGKTYSVFHIRADRIDN